MAIGGAALKLFQTLLYATEFVCAAVILGIYSYFLSVLADRDAQIYTWVKAVEGISGAAVLYTLFAVLLTCCLGGKPFFAFIAIVLDILFCAGFVVMAILTRDGAHSCNRPNISTPIGKGNPDAKQGFDSSDQGNQITYAVSLRTACRLNTACFSVAILGAVLFFLSTLVQFGLARHHKTQKKYGPSPANGYTAGRTGGRFWRRRRVNPALRDPEVAVVPTTVAPIRHSHDTAFTGSTAARTSAAYETPHKPLTGGYHAAPTATYPTPATNY